jgi:hypothetical protein
MTKGIFSIVTVFILFTSNVVAWEQIKCIAPINKDKKKHWTTKLYRPVIDPISIPEGSPQYIAVLEAIERMNLNLTLAILDMNWVAWITKTALQKITAKAKFG